MKNKAKGITYLQKKPSAANTYPNGKYALIIISMDLRAICTVLPPNEPRNLAIFPVNWPVLIPADDELYLSAIINVTPSTLLNDGSWFSKFDFNKLIMDAIGFDFTSIKLMAGFDPNSSAPHMSACLCLPCSLAVPSLPQCNKARKPY